MNEPERTTDEKLVIARQALEKIADELRLFMGGPEIQNVYKENPTAKLADEQYLLDLKRVLEQIS